MNFYMASLGIVKLLYKKLLIMELPVTETNVPNNWQPTVE